MAFEEAEDRAANQPSGERRKVAVIGSGVSGLSAGWLLAADNDVVLYERAVRLGGHANTIDVPAGDAGGGGRMVPVDTGFIVFNRPNYPNFTALLDALGVRVDDTCMSFAASLRGGEVEYAGHGAATVFARPASIFSSRHWRMLGDIARFHREAKAALRNGLDDDVSLAAFVAQKRYSAGFVEDFLIPFGASIWSTPSSDILDYPAGALFRFFDNHGLLQVRDMPLWSTVAGGSRAYVERMARPLAARARLGVEVVRVTRAGGSVIVTDAAGGEDRFDHVVIATHADQALGLLADASEAERAILGAFRYQPNRAVVHSDPRHMPRRRKVWSSWNYLGGQVGASITYWMNQLQNLDCRRNVFVTLNPQGPVDPAAFIAAFDYTHPMFNVAAGKAQRDLWTLQGKGGVWFCGAHFGQGFHEDGLQAGLAVAEAIGARARPWTVANASARIFLPRHWPAMAAE